MFHFFLLYLICFYAYLRGYLLNRSQDVFQVKQLVKREVQEPCILRIAQIEDLISELKNPDSPYQTTLVYGQRGSGKTSFMSALCLELEKEKDFIILNIPSSGNILLSYVQGIYSKTSKAVQKTLDSLDGVPLSVFGVQLEYNKKDTGQINYQILLEKILKKLSEKKITVLAVIDEVKASGGLKDFISVYQILLQQNLPVRLLLAGLPQNVSELQNDNRLTFLIIKQTSYGYVGFALLYFRESLPHNRLLYVIL